LFYTKLDSVFTKNPKSQFSGELFSDVILDPVFTFQEAMSLYSVIDSTVQQKSTIQSIKESLERLKTQRIGTKFQNFSLQDKDGKMLNTLDFNKEYLLIEFWASNCLPCRKANPELVKIYHKYKTKGFDVFGVSTDRSKEAWLKAVEKDGLQWTQTITADGYNDKVLEDLKIQYMPSNYLIDKDSNILAINITPKALNEKLNELYQE